MKARVNVQAILTKTHQFRDSWSLLEEHFLDPLVGDCSIPMSSLCARFVQDGEGAFRAVAGCIVMMRVLSPALCSVVLIECEVRVLVADGEGWVELCFDDCFVGNYFVTFLVPEHQFETLVGQ